MTVPVTIGHDDPVVYHVIETDAPSDYDGFGTFSLNEYEGVRTVLIRAEHLTWQTCRYQSGNHYSNPVNMGESAITDILWGRLLQRGLR